MVLIAVMVVLPSNANRTHTAIADLSQNIAGVVN